ASPKVTASSKSIVLLTQLAPGGKDAEIPLSAGQVNGNLINTEGLLKAYIYLPYLIAIRLFKKNFTSLKGFEKDVHTLFRLLPDYNCILGENRDIEAKDLVVEDLEKVMAAAATSNKLYYRVYSSQTVRIQYNLKCKYASSDPSSPYKEITALSYSTTNIREIVEKVKKRTVKLSRFYKGELFTLLKVERERYRWTYKALSKLIEAYNKQVDLAESQGLSGSQPLIELELFNTTISSREISEDQGDTITEGEGN
ncbi:hypothetical protein NA56DRAFT_649639, partial [Hyaloscypha hepaticicola]